jgi:hypothetical protein
MRPSIALTAVVLAGAVAAAVPATAAGPQRISANPQTVKRNAIQTVHGRGWPVIEFCSRTVRVYVRSDQNSVAIAQRHISDEGRFGFRWIPKNRNVARGDWRLVARMRCESGKDGSRFFVKARTSITIN